MFKFCIFFFILFYYVSKANDLLSNQKSFIKGLRVFFILGVVLIVAGGIYLTIGINDDQIKKNGLCREW
jgi:cell shape-determining protein MreD